MVKTKRAYDPVDALDGDRTLVTRYWPRGVSRERLSITEWLRNLAPEILSNVVDEIFSDLNAEPLRGLV